MVGGLLAWLESSGGEVFLRAQIQARLGREIRGSLSIGALSFDYRGRVALADVVLRDPDGREVARVGRIEADVRLPRLLARAVVLSRLEVREASLDLEEGPDGLNLARALAPRSPSAPQPPSGPSGWSVEVDSLSVESLAALFRSEPGGAPAIAVRAIGARGWGRYSGGDAALDLELAGEALAPFEEPLSLRLVARGEGPLRVEALDLRLGASHLALKGVLRGEVLDAKVSELTLARRDLLALWPDAPFVGALSAAGDVALGVGGLVADVRARVEGSRTVAIRGTLSFSPLGGRARASLDRADLQAILAGAPPSSLNGRAEVRFDAESADVTVDLGPSTLGGQELEAVRGEVAVRGATIAPSLTLSVPGARATVSGTATGTALDLGARIFVSDFSRASRSLALLVGAEPSAVAGRGTLEGRLTGTPNAPRLSLSGQFDELTIGALELQQVGIRARLPDARRPFRVEASVGAERGHLADLPFSHLFADVRADGHVFQARLATSGLAGLSGQVAGELDRDERGARISLLTLATDGTRWTLAAPATLDLRDGVRVDRLQLRSGDQSLEVTGGMRRGALDLSFATSRLDLARLPRALGLERLGLAGRVEARGQVRGTPRRPEGSASLVAAGLSVAGWTGLDVRADAAAGSVRFGATATVRRREASAELRVDLPWAGLRAPAGTALSASLVASEIGLGELGRTLRLPGLRGGRGALRADLSGTSGAPRLRATAAVQQGAWGRAPPVDATARLDSADGTSLAATLSTAGGQVSLEATARVSLRALAARPTLAALGAVPMRTRVVAASVALAPFAGSLLPTGTEGVASLEADLAGSVAQPRGEATVGLERGAVAHLRDLSGSLKLSARADSLQISGDAALAARPVARLTARFGRPVEALRSLAGLSAAPAAVRLEAGPIDPRTVFALAEDAPRGLLRGTVTLSGSLGAPSVTGSARLDEFEAGGEPLAALVGEAEYRAGTARATVWVQPGRGGADATVRATLGADLSLPSLLRGVAWMRAPIDATLAAKDLDLRSLEGVLPGLRSVGGLLTSQARVVGTLGEPTPRGTLALREGHFTLSGYGSWRDVALDLSVSDQALELSRLVGRSGTGGVEAWAKGQRAGPGEPFQVTAQASAERVPVVVEDQLVAYVTGRTERWTGQIQGRRITSTVRLAEVTIDLPPASTKNLQPLSPNPDVVVRTGRARRARRAAPAFAQGLEASLRVEAPSKVWIQSEDARIETAADLEVILGRGPVEIRGVAQTLQGRADVIGRRFEIERGRLTWAGDPPSNPRVDVQATHENAREQVKVFVHVTGAAQAPRIELASEPPLDEQQIATLLATGRRELKRGSGGVASGGAASVLTGFAADRLRRALAARLPLDVLRVEVGDRGLQSTRLEAGTYVTDRIYVGYRRNFGAETERGENANEVRVEYQLSPRVTVESQYGDGGRGGANVVYTRDY